MPQPSGAGERIATGRADWMSPASFSHPTHLVESAWLEHGPFAFWIIDALRPSIVVELGTHNGYSFFAFTEAVRRLGLPTRSFAVDTWVGDDHAGFYSEEVYDSVKQITADDYSQGATLLRGLFDDHVGSFDDGSIDLLHIDGRHGYDDVKHDFESWLPKMSSTGVVLFHDVVERDREFGVWKLWAELEARYPSFFFEHGHGLGVIAVGSTVPPGIQRLLDADPDEIEDIRLLYRELGAEVPRAHAAEIEARNERQVLLRRLEETDAALAKTRDDLESVVTSLTWRWSRRLRTASGPVSNGVRALLRRSS